MKKPFIFASLAVLALASCNKVVNTEDPQILDGEYAGSVKVTVADFICDDGTKATVTTKGVFNWSDGDQIGIWPMSVAPRTSCSATHVQDNGWGRNFRHFLRFWLGPENWRFL